MLRDLFGFRAERVPVESSNRRTHVSLLEKLQGLQGKHFHINVHRVGFDELFHEEEEANDKLDFAILRAHEIFHEAGLEIGRIVRLVIPSNEAEGLDDLANESDADKLISGFQFKENDGIDVFVVRNISATFVGLSPQPGPCKPSRDAGFIGGEIGRDKQEVARTLAHELGHFLGLDHNHEDDGIDCPSGAEKRNLMAQTRCVKPNIRDSVELNEIQRSTIKTHCSARGIPA